MRLASFLLVCLLMVTLLTGCAAPQSAQPAAPANNNAGVPANTAALADQAAPADPTAPANTAKSAILWPTKGWQTAKPETQGLDPQQLDKLRAYIKEQKIDLHSLLIIRNGYILFEDYYASNKQDTLHVQYSVTKSFISTLVGIALDQGKLTSLDQRTLDLLPGRQFANVDANKQSMRLEDMLMMASGLDCSDDTDINRLYSSNDWVKAMLDIPMVAKPGQTFKYCSGVTHVISDILREATGQKADQYADKYLFGPLGIKNYRWEADRQGIPIGGWGLNLTPRDMAKLGYLYLHNGEWDGKQVVSASWVKQATTRHISTDGKLGYGYQWWTYPTHNAYTALGRDGQTIFVVPELNLIVVTTANLPEGHDPIFNLIDNFILPAVSE